jgi:glycerol-3-phosphate dehydrogenase subunit B
VLVLGAGLAGLACALRLADADADVTVLARGAGSLPLGGATIDVLGAAPERVERPLDVLAGLPADHPYRVLGASRVETATRWLAGRLPELRLRGRAERNMLLPTALGVPRPTALAPAAVAAGDLARGGPLTLVGFRAVKDFPAALAAANVAAACGVETRAVEVGSRLFGEADLSPIAVARALDAPGPRAGFLRALRDAVGAAAGRVGLPALLGLERHDDVVAATRDALGCEVFEVVTVPPSVPGLRLAHALERALRERRVRVVIGARAAGAERDGGRLSAIVAEVAGGRRNFAASEVVLATGGIAAGGIDVDAAGGVREAVLGLPLAHAPAGPAYAAGAFASDPVDRVGIAVDASLRPLGPDGDVLHPNLRAAGALLAGAAPWRELSGNGLALASGVAAADAILAEAGIAAS